jgi:hypothetical protein
MNNNEMTVIDLENLDVENFKLGKSGRAVKLLYNKEPVQICTSTLYSPFGIKSINKEWSNFTEYNVDCSLNQSSSETSVVFKNFIDKLDDVIQKLVKENLTLFNSKNETANENFTYTSILRENKSYPKLMKLQFTRDKQGNFESFIFDEQKEKIPINENNIDNIITKGKIFKTMIECVKVWYYNGKVGSIWKIVQLKFCEKERVKMIDENCEEEENENLIQENNNVKNIYNQLMIID